MKIIDLAQLDEIRGNRILVTTNGTFDILHVGHLRILQQARQLGDILLVLVNSDISVRLNKAPQRPIVPEGERMELLAGLACVDYVSKFDDREVLHVLARIKPDIHAKGGTFIPERVAEEKSVVESYGGRHICLGKIGDYSSTNIIEKIESILRQGTKGQK